MSKGLRLHRAGELARRDSEQPLRAAVRLAEPAQHAFPVDFHFLGRTNPIALGVVGTSRVHDPFFARKTGTQLPNV